MKKVLLIITSFALATTSIGLADIQEPPGSHFTPTRKLSRAVANIFYGTAEIPATWRKTVNREGPNTAAPYALIEGSKRTIARFGFGFFELVTFPWATHKGSFRHPYTKDWYRPYKGYSEFPPELGFESQLDYSQSEGY